ncbi:Threonine aldolase [Rhodotorula mucilaginosa]|uniref:Threonine aldolase n=1 Tax=Rhodotorula mucilaginosa TaxID=5537 RepID=A0A9P6W512_RHOMI|nr:Threonine aldolase [Rhodotorula mucilaginosa]
MVKPIQGTQYALDAQFKKISRDFRTDTITMPTDEMFDLMRHASRGDDVYGEDQATNDLQDKIAKMAGKEAGLFCVSGTMTNQLAIRTHLTQPPHSIILDARSHVHLYEAGGVAMHSQASSHAVPPKNGHHLTLEEVLDNCVFGEDIHSAPTKLVSLENTLSGMVFPQEEIIRISDCMRANGIIMHCDGARMWEVAAKTGMSLEELCRPFDTVSLCLSKGLGAPVGSVLVGPRKFIEKVKWFRKAFGGGIRQCGSLSVSANYCVDNHFPKLKATHELTSYLAKALAELGAQLLLPVETNMLWLDPSSLGFPITTLAERAKTRGLTLGSNRVVVHHQITREAVDDLIQLVSDMKDEFKDRDEPKREIDQEQNLLYAQGVYQRPIEPPIARLGTSYGKNQ